MKFVIFTILFAGACFAFPQDQSWEPLNNLAKAIDDVTKGINDVDTTIVSKGVSGVQGDFATLGKDIGDVILGFSETNAAFTSGDDQSIGIQHTADSEEEVYAGLEALTDGSSTTTTGSLDTVNSDMDALAQKIGETADILATLPEETSRPLGVDAALSDIALSLNSLAASRIDLGATIKRADDVTDSALGTAKASQNLGIYDQILANGFDNLLRQ